MIEIEIAGEVNATAKTLCAKQSVVVAWRQSVDSKQLWWR
jgi:hypothetical protein